MQRAAVRLLIAVLAAPLVFAAVQQSRAHADATGGALPPVAAPTDAVYQADTPADVTLAGVWDFGDGLIVQIEQSGTSISGTVVKHECSGADPSEYLTATVDGKTLEGTMHRCTPEDDTSVTEYGCAQEWDTPFEAEVTRHEIVGTYRGQYIVDTGCEIEYEYDADFSGSRIDCRPLTFEELAEEHPEHAHEVALAKQFEQNDDKLEWTDEQVANGFKARAEAFAADMARVGAGRYAPATIKSAYRPALYQAHFGNLRECALTLIQALQDWLHEPDVVEAIADSVDALNKEVLSRSAGGKHGIESDRPDVIIAGHRIRVAYVCYRVLTSCKHVNGKAVDMTFREVGAQVDWDGELRGWCRRYLLQERPDWLHWEEISGGQCGPTYAETFESADIEISVESPVAIMLTDSTGRRIGHDPATGSTVNDFGAGAFYSGAESEPQHLFVPAAVAAGDEVEVTLTPTGDGPYRVRLAFFADDGTDASEVVMEGVAELGQPIAPVRHTFTPASNEPMFPEAAPIAAEAGWGESFEARTGGDAPVVVSLNPPMAEAVLVNEELGAVGIRLAEGTLGQVAVRVPNAVVEPPVRVLVDGQDVPSSVEPGERNTTVRFAAPASASVVEIRGRDATSGEGGWPPAAPIVIVLLVIAVAAGAFLLLRRRTPASAPPTG